MAASSSRQGEIEIEIEDVGRSSRQDDPFTGEGSHEYAAGDTEAGDTRMHPQLYEYAMTSLTISSLYMSCSLVQFLLAMRSYSLRKFLQAMRSCSAIKFLQAMITGNFAEVLCVMPIPDIPEEIVKLVQSSEDKVSTRGNTVLHLAASTGNVQLIELITKYFPGLVHKQNADGELPLHVAASAGHLPAVLWLQATPQGNKFNERDGRGNTALHVAVENNHQDVAMFLVGQDDGSTSHSTNNSGKTPLGMAAETANLELVTAMVKEKPDSTANVNFWQGSKGYSILRAAIIWRKKAIGGYTDDTYEDFLPSLLALSIGIYPILFMAMFTVGSLVPNLFQIIASKQQHVPYRTKYTNLLETILSKMDSPLINSTDQEWMSPLTLAAYTGNFVAVRVLLHNKNFTGLAYEREGNQFHQFLPIHVASKKGHCRVVEEFLKHYPDLRESCDDEGRNILHLAAAHGRVKVAQYIIGRRDLQVLSKKRDNSGNTPLHTAVQNWHPKIVEILSFFHARERANLNNLNNEGRTALDLAEKTEVDITMSFRRKLTLMALKLANAPRSEERTADKAKLVEDSVLQSLPSSDNLMFSEENVNTLLLVSTLVVGITFAHGFTIPGGYHSSGNDEGAPVFLKHILFKIFVICNNMAMYGALTASVALMWTRTYDPNIIYPAMKFTLTVLGVTLTMMSLSFTAGVALIVYNLLWLCIVVITMGLFFTVFIICILASLVDFGPNYSIFRTLMIVSRYNSDNDRSNRWSFDSIQLGSLKALPALGKIALLGESLLLENKKRKYFRDLI